jgi:hypothetical protein
MRLNALFKPEWSPEMLHSVNYLTHLNVMRTSILREIGGWRPETDGAQDWDLFFRITERTDKIARIPSIHYHWRILPTSTATGLQAKPYAAQGQLRAQQDHFRRRELPATVIPSPEGTVLEAGRVMTESHATAPLFSGTPLFSFGWFGGPLWYRNASACSPYAIAMSVADLSKAIEKMPLIEDPARDFASLCVHLRKHGKRGLINPFARVYFTEAPESHWDNDARLYANDPYFNPSFVGVSPLQLHT